MNLSLLEQIGSTIYSIQRFTLRAKEYDFEVIFFVSSHYKQYSTHSRREYRMILMSYLKVLALQEDNSKSRIVKILYIIVHSTYTREL